MGKAAHKGRGRYCISTKPPSRKKKFRERRKMIETAAVMNASEIEVRNESSDVNNNFLNASDTAIEQCVDVISAPVDNDVAKSTNSQHDVTVSQRVIMEIDNEDNYRDEEMWHLIRQGTESDYDGKKNNINDDDDDGNNVSIVSHEIMECDFQYEAESNVDDFLDLIIEPEDVQEVALPEDVGTRHIVDFPFMFSELHRKFDDHGGGLQCRFESLKLISCQRIALRTRYQFQCEMCNWKKFIWSESEEPEILSVDESAVAAAISIGIGYAQLRELLSAMNIPCMAEKTYMKYHDRVAIGFEKAAEEEMKSAGEEEKRLAIERGDVINGIPFIPVVADGSWMKRSYRTGKYDSPAGVGVIIGHYTQRVLFAGVRNRFCTICVMAERKKESAKEHQCWKNWGSNQSSTSMESNAIADGFKCSIEMHGLIYSKLIADGDSSVYTRIVQSDPYFLYRLQVEKIECTNHLLRCFGTKMKDAEKTKISKESKDKIKKLSKTKKSVGMWRKVVEGCQLRFHRAIVKAVEYRKQEDASAETKIDRLRRDLQNMPSHIFGEHKDCARLQYFCNGMPKEDEENVVPILMELQIYDKITDALNYVSRHAKSLLERLTSNSAESYNAIVSKFIGGKRVNFGKRNSYQARCAGAVCQFNSQDSYAVLSIAMGKTPTAEIQKVQAKRRNFNKHRLEKKRDEIAAGTYKKYPPPQAPKSSASKDKDYGPLCEKPDLTAEEFEAQVKLHYERLVDNQNDREQIEVRTRNQADSSEWKTLRRKLLTASNFGKVCRMRPKTSSANTVKSLLYSHDLSLPALEYGKKCEEVARRDLEMAEKVKISPCGLFIDPEHPYLAATPDGLIDDDGVVEIKCPLSAKDITPQDAIEKKVGDIHRIFDRKDTKVMNQNHPYYYQVQGQLHITKRKYCIFLVWTQKGLKSVNVKRDDVFWDTQMSPFLTKFYKFCMVPEIIDSRHLRNLPLREPQHILDAQNEKQSKTKSEKNSV